MLAIVLLARCFRDEPGLRFLWNPSVVTLALFVATLALFAVLRGDEGIGITQRVSATAVHAWIAVVAVGLERWAPASPAPP